MKPVKLFAGLVAVAAGWTSASAAAADWVLVRIQGNAPDQALILVDREAIDPDARGSDKANLATVILYEGKPVQVLTPVQIDCDERILAFASAEIRDWDGELVRTVPGEFSRRVSVGRPGDDLVRIACDGSWPAGTVAYGEKAMSAIYHEWFGE